MRCLYQINDTELYSFSFASIDSRMYLLFANKQALIIDTCVNEETLQLLHARNITDILIILTHEHYDHISGVNWFRKHFNCKVLASAYCAENIINPKRNMSAYIEALFNLKEDEFVLQNIEPYICRADEVFNQYISFSWQKHKVEIFETPGHSLGSVCIIIDNQYVFTGDSLIKNSPVITVLPGGSKRQYNEFTLPFLQRLPQSAIVLPGHGEAGFLSEFSLTITKTNTL